jgi:hypothetical protein
VTYLYQKIQSGDFTDTFRNMGRKDQFSYAGLHALYEYLEQLAEDTGEPMELDVIALCCDYSEYATLAEYNTEYGTEYESWDDVAEETTVIEHSNGAAIVQAH